MNLNATSHIVTNTELIAELNAKYSNGNNILSPEVFYTKQLLDTIRLDGDQYCYYRLADVSPIGEKADKLALRRWAPLQAHTQPLTEGMPPMSDKGSVEKYEITCAQYGRYMEFSDHVDFKIVDPIIAFYTQEYSLVAVETLDLLAREALFSIANLAFAGGAADIVALAENSISTTAATAALARPHMDDLRKIVLSLKKRLVKPRMNGRFHVIGSPEFYFDMIDDERVKNYMSYNQTTDTMYSNSKLVPMFEMEFYETLCCPSSGEYFGSDGSRRLLVKYNNTASTTKIGFLSDTASTSGALVSTAQYAEASGYVKDQRTGEDASYIPNLGTWTMPADSTAEGSYHTNVEEYKVQHILIVGKDALIRTGLSGEDSAKMYVKQKGSSGVLDPIDQRQSIGFKINSVGFGSARLEAVVDYVCVPSTLNF